MSCAAGSAALERLGGRLAALGYPPFPFQRETWARVAAGQHTLAIAPTGAGKTLAALGAPLARALATGDGGDRLRLLWVSPLRALAADTAAQATSWCRQLGVPWRVLLRSADADRPTRALARAGRGAVLVTTPESLALLLSHEEFQRGCAGLWAAVVDEWHEYLGGKRGALLELCLARLRSLAPGLVLIGLSATLAEPERALAALAPGGGAMVRAAGARPLALESLLPPPGTSLSLLGHHGLELLPQVLERLLAAPTSLVFCNTRALAEQWFAALAAVWPGTREELGLHHGSLAAPQRAVVEQGLRSGRLRAVVATASLDLGVDLPAVTQAIQIGSPRGIARALQRAGRARHRPGAPAALLLVPTNAWDLVEFAALRRALARGHVEPRPSISLPLDVLAQHLVTLALAGGLDPEQAWTEARGTAAFAALRREDFDALLGMLERGGSALARYPEFARLRADDDGRWRPATRAVARDHRLAIGTLLGEELIPVRSPAGRALGELEERFLARLRPGEAFRLGGQVYRLLALREDHAVARPARGERAIVPRWLGGRMALTPELGGIMLEVLAGGDEPELAPAAPLLAEQARGSACPRPGELLVELIEAEGERVLCLYPFAGRELHAGLAALLGVRLGLLAAGPLTFAADERGLLLGLAGAWPDAERLRAALAAEPLAEELAVAVDLSTLERRRFHAVAQIAGLVPRARGGARRSARHVRLSTALLYEVLRRHDPEHPMLVQARRETLEEELALGRLAALCARLREQPLRICRPPRPTPLAAPLLSERRRAVLGPDRLEDRARRLAAALGAGDG